MSKIKQNIEENTSKSDVLQNYLHLGRQINDQIMIFAGNWPKQCL